MNTGAGSTVALIDISLARSQEYPDRHATSTDVSVNEQQRAGGRMSAIREGRVIASRYELERPLARGGMGSVWVARHLQLESTVAIKFIEPQLSHLSEARGRFEREAKVAAQLQGPNLVQIHDYGVEDDTPYMVMEYLQGEDLCARMNREKQLSLAATADIVSQVVKVLQRAHEAGIVHRDLKPGNIFLVRGEEDDEIVKVLDFGLAKIPRSPSSDDMTKSGMLLGSPRYMSPEQARGMKNIDHRSDLWSLAVIAFRAVTGELPFPGDEIGDVLVKICAERAPTPSAIDPTLSPAIDLFFERAFKHDPMARFQSARELARAFISATTGRPALLSSSPALLGGTAPIDAIPIDSTPAAPESRDPNRAFTTPAEDAASTPTVDEIRTVARLSWIGTPSESPDKVDVSSMPAGSDHAPRRRGRVAAAAVAILASSVGLILYATFAKGWNHAPVAPPATAILADSAPQSPSAPVVVADAALPPALIPAVPTSADPAISPPPPRPAGAISTAKPLSTPKALSRKRSNSILGI